MNIRTLCLGILSFGDATGYEIKKMAEDGLFSHFVEASYGSIYPALTRMTDEGLLTCRSEAQDGKPDKKVYSITKAGRDELTVALTTRPKKDKFKSEFLFILLMSEHLDQEHVCEVLAQRAEELAAELEMIQACGAHLTTPGPRFVNGYGQAVVGAAHDYVSKNLDFSISPAEPSEAAARTPQVKVEAAE